MKLDKRILPGKKPLDCFDVDIAKQFIGQSGYFSHYIDNYADLKNTVLGTLGSTGDTFHESFCCTEEPNDNYYYEFFIHAEWLKPEEPEKKYRPYTMSEFKSEFKINTILTLRKRNEDKYVYQTVYLGNRHYDDTDSDENFIYLSHGTYSPKELFEKFEIVRNGDWQPFGVIDEDKE